MDVAQEAAPTPPLGQLLLQSEERQRELAKREVAVRAVVEAYGRMDATVVEVAVNHPAVGPEVAVKESVPLQAVNILSVPPESE